VIKGIPHPDHVKIRVEDDDNVTRNVNRSRALILDFLVENHRYRVSVAQAVTIVVEVIQVNGRLSLLRPDRVNLSIHDRPVRFPNDGAGQVVFPKKLMVRACLGVPTPTLDLGLHDIFDPDRFRRAPCNILHAFYPVSKSFTWRF
jgi:hypothetical protein